jgi:hypothetical protein
MRLFRKFSIRRRLVLLKSTSSSSRYKIISRVEFFAFFLSQLIFIFIRSLSFSFEFSNQDFSSFRLEIDDSEDEIRENRLFSEIRNSIERKMLIDSKSFE